MTVRRKCRRCRGLRRAVVTWPIVFCTLAPAPNFALTSALLELREEYWSFPDK